MWKCCCGFGSEHIVFVNVAVANVLGTSDLEMLLWDTLWTHRIWKCFCGERSRHIGFGNVGVGNSVSTSGFGNVAGAQVLGTSDLEMLLWQMSRAHRI